MSGMFSSPKTPKIRKQEVVESVTKITDDANDEQKRVRQRISQASGYQSTVMAGIQSALKRRLGE